MTMNPKLILCLALACSSLLNSNCGAAIVYPKAPEGGRHIATGSINPKFLGVPRVSDLAIAKPYRAYFVGLTNLASGHLLSAAKPRGWIYLLMRGANAAGAVDLAPDKTGTKLLFAGLYKSDFSNETREALRRAERLPRVQKQRYELRRLECSAILFVAVWLHGESDDIILPLSPTFGRWEAYHPYSERQILKLLKPEAKKKLKDPRRLD
jgi:hypothetical protein